MRTMCEAMVDANGAPFCAACLSTSFTRNGIELTCDGCGDLKLEPSYLTLRRHEEMVVLLQRQISLLEERKR